MSASFCWRPTTPKGGKDLGVDLPTAFKKAMDRAFGQNWPLTLHRDTALPILQGMAAVSEEAGFKELIEVLERFDEVEVSVDY